MKMSAKVGTRLEDWASVKPVKDPKSYPRSVRHHSISPPDPARHRPSGRGSDGRSKDRRTATAKRRRIRKREIHSTTGSLSVTRHPAPWGGNAAVSELVAERKASRTRGNRHMFQRPYHGETRIDDDQEMNVTEEGLHAVMTKSKYYGNVSDHHNHSEHHLRKDQSQSVSRLSAPHRRGRRATQLPNDWNRNLRGTRTKTRSEEKGNDEVLRNQEGKEVVQDNRMTSRAHDNLSSKKKKSQTTVNTKGKGRQTSRKAYDGGDNGGGSNASPNNDSASAEILAMELKRLDAQLQTMRKKNRQLENTQSHGSKRGESHRDKRQKDSKVRDENPPRHSLLPNTDRKQISKMMPGTTENRTRIMSRLMASAYTTGGVDWHKLFQHYDRNHAGNLSMNEFKRLLRSGARITKSALSNDDIAAMFRLVDRNNDGRIQLDEFYEWVQLSKKNDKNDISEQTISPSVAARLQSTSEGSVFTSSTETLGYSNSRKNVDGVDSKKRKDDISGSNSEDNWGSSSGDENTDGYIQNSIESIQDVLSRARVYMNGEYSLERAHYHLDLQSPLQSKAYSNFVDETSPSANTQDKKVAAENKESSFANVATLQGSGVSSLSGQSILAGNGRSLEVSKREGNSYDTDEGYDSDFFADEDDNPPSEQDMSAQQKLLLMKTLGGGITRLSTTSPEKAEIQTNKHVDSMSTFSMNVNISSHSDTSTTAKDPAVIAYNTLLSDYRDRIARSHDNRETAMSIARSQVATELENMALEVRKIQVQLQSREAAYKEVQDEKAALLQYVKDLRMRLLDLETETTGPECYVPDLMVSSRYSRDKESNFTLLKNAKSGIGSLNVASPQKVLSGYRRARGDVARSEAAAQEFEALLSDASAENEILKETLRQKNEQLSQADIELERAVMRERAKQSKSSLIAQSEKEFLKEALESRDKMIISLSIRLHKMESRLSAMSNVNRGKKTTPDDISKAHAPREETRSTHAVGEIYEVEDAGESLSLAKVARDAFIDNHNDSGSVKDLNVIATQENTENMDRTSRDEFVDNHNDSSTGNESNEMATKENTETMGRISKQFEDESSGYEGGSSFVVSTPEITEENSSQMDGGSTLPQQVPIQTNDAKANNVFTRPPPELDSPGKLPKQDVTPQTPQSVSDSYAKPLSTGSENDPSNKAAHLVDASPQTYKQQSVPANRITKIYSRPPPSIDDDSESLFLSHSQPMAFLSKLKIRDQSQNGSPAEIPYSVTTLGESRQSILSSQGDLPLAGSLPTGPPPSNSSPEGYPLVDPTLASFPPAGPPPAGPPPAGPPPAGPPPAGPPPAGPPPAGPPPAGPPPAGPPPAGPPPASFPPIGPPPAGLPPIGPPPAGSPPLGPPPTGPPPYLPSENGVPLFPLGTTP